MVMEMEMGIAGIFLPTLRMCTKSGFCYAGIGLQETGFAREAMDRKVRAENGRLYQLMSCVADYLKLYT